MHTARRAQGALPTASNGRPAWIPNDPNGTRPKLDETLGHDDEAIMRRNTLAQTAQERYDVWAATTDAPELEELSIHPSRHTFRGRDVGKELHGSGSRMVFRAFNSEQERVVAAAREHSSSSLKQPVYSNPGRYTIGTTYSFTRRGYLARQRMKSMELGGPMRYQSPTERERIMDAKRLEAVLDVLDEYSPEVARAKSEQFLMYKRQEKDKWVGARDFYRGGSTGILNRFQGSDEKHREVPDQDTYGLLNFGHVRVRVPAKEIGGDFKTSVPQGIYLPNLNKSCSWNVLPTIALLPLKTYYRAGSAVPLTISTATQ